MANIYFHLEQECQAQQWYTPNTWIYTHTHSLSPTKHPHKDCSLALQQQKCGLQPLHYLRSFIKKKNLNYPSKPQINVYNLLRNWYAIQ